MSSTARRVGQGSGFRMIDPKLTSKGKLVTKRGPKHVSATEVSDRLFKPAKAFFTVPVYQPREFQFRWQAAKHDFFEVEKPLMIAAFDAPETVTAILRDAAISGQNGVFSEEWLDKCAHWVQETRYWRCLGIHQPFFDNTTPRAYVWAENNTEVGRVHITAAMKDALKDLETAYQRKVQGLEPNYKWDRWGPVGFVDGARMDYLPRFDHNPHMDPDGVQVSDEDIAQFATHDMIKERYQELIFGDAEQYQGVFTQATNAGLFLHDLPEPVVELYHRVNADADSDVVSIPQNDLRTLLYLTAFPSMAEECAKAETWEDVEALVATKKSPETDLKVEACRLHKNTAHDVDAIKQYYAEKCGWEDFDHTPDKAISAAVLACIQDMKAIVAGQPEWGPALFRACSDTEMAEAVGDDAFEVYSTLEELRSERTRQRWAQRFSGEANEEKSLDYMLSNFTKRTESSAETNVKTNTGSEFDREVEPIGRSVQRRVLQSDKKAKTKRRFEGHGAEKKKVQNPLAKLHRKVLVSGF